MYLFYVDESGNRGVRPSDSKKAYSNENRFYVLLACGILEHYWFKFEQHINAVKRKVLTRINNELGLSHTHTLGLHDAEIKSQYLRNRLARMDSHKGLRFWQRVTASDIEDLSGAVHRSLEYYHIDICAVVVDKEYLASYFDSNLLHRKSYELLLERVQNLMRERYPKHKALLIVDSSNDTENLSLIQKHDFFVNEGKTSSGCRLDKIVQSPLFIKSQLAVGIQVSDVCAYNVMRAFRDNNLNYEYFCRLHQFIYNSQNTNRNKVDGLKVFPPESPFA